MEPGDKFQEHFRVSLEVVVSPKERPQPGSSYPWQGFTGKGLGPRILFTTKEEQEEILNQYGRLFYFAPPLSAALFLSEAVICIRKLYRVTFTSSIT